MQCMYTPCAALSVSRSLRCRWQELDRASGSSIQTRDRPALPRCLIWDSVRRRQHFYIQYVCSFRLSRFPGNLIRPRPPASASSTIGRIDAQEGFVRTPHPSPPARAQLRLHNDAIPPALSEGDPRIKRQRGVVDRDKAPPPERYRLSTALKTSPARRLLFSSFSTLFSTTRAAEGTPATRSFLADCTAVDLCPSQQPCSS